MAEGCFSGYTCVKLVFFAFNVLFWLLGCSILGIGIWLHVAKGNYAALAPNFDFLSATALCIAAGTLVLVVGFFGCCGAIMENQCLLLSYFLIVVVIFILEIVAGIIAFVYRTELENTVKRELVTGLQVGFPDNGLHETWSKIQQDLQCCGVNNYTDWYSIDEWKGKSWVTDSCCKFQTPNCGRSADPARWFDRGCFDEIKYQIKSNLYVVGVVGVTIGVLQILGLAASMALFCCLRGDKEYD